MMNPTLPKNCHVPPSLLSGALGLVIVPDQKTIERAYALAGELMPRDAHYVLRSESLPHLTLYHGRLVDLPGPSAAEILGQIRVALVGQKLTLSRIVTFGGKFVFWNVDSSRCDYHVLQAAHEKALEFAQYLDRSTVARAVSEEALSLTDTEQSNVQRFGHPLVGALYMPHVTLGFHHGISDYVATDITCEWQMQVVSVELVKVGHPGRVEEIIDPAQAP